MTDMATGLLSGMGGEVYKDVKNTIVFAGKEIDYGKNVEQIYESLIAEKNRLCARRDDVVSKIDGDKTKRASKELKLWIDSVRKLEEEVLNLENKFYKEKRHSFKVIRLLQRSNLGKTMVEKLNEIQSCLAKGDAYATDVVVEVLQRPVISKRRAPKIEDKPSLYRAFEDIINFFRRDDLKAIGLWGKVGVGKTAIMQNLNESKQVAEMFDVVIFVTQIEEWNEEKLQREIAKQLDLNLEDSGSIKAIASAIAEKLKCKRYLLLLDDVSTVFDLDDIGICDNGKNSKVVLASRDRGVCLCMSVDDLIQVHPLTPNDALKLFEQCLGRNISADFKPMAQQIIRECNNLPLLIDKVAVNFRKKDKIALWRAGLNNLQTWPNAEDRSMDEVLDKLRFCYEELGDKKKLCFLYGALYSEGRDLYTDYLVECWRAEDFIHDADQFVRDKGQEILCDLIDASLLEVSDKPKHVRMDKVFRKMALKISSENSDSKCLVRADKELRDPPNEKDWEYVKRISLMDNNLGSLPEKPNCNNLSSLLLQRNGGLVTIPKKFFVSMQKLRVLDLHATNINALPPSISYLKCLRALYLNSCKMLLDLPSKVKDLVSLEVLDIRGTGIYFVPVHIVGLGKLRCFRMSFSKGDTKVRKSKIYQNEISKLSLLEELVIDVHPEIQRWNEVVNDILKDVANLSKLTLLSLSVGQYHVVRHKILDYVENKNCKCLKYANGNTIDPFITEVLAKTNAFELIGHQSNVRLSDFGLKNFNNVITCIIEGCNEMETIIDGNVISEAVLVCLKKLYISNASKLQSIWEGPVPNGSLGQLTTLLFFRCSMLKKIFSAGLIPHLINLEHLEVESCHEIEEIIMQCENSILESHALPSLKTLILVDLPRLVSVSSDNLLERPTLERIIDRCPLLQAPPRCHSVN